MTVDDSSEGRVGDGVLARKILEILGLVGSLGISRISGVSSSESSRCSASSINTNNGNGVGGSGRETIEEDGRVVGNIGSGSTSRGSVGHLPQNASSGGITPGQAQIIDVISVVRSESTAGIVIGEIDGCSGNWCADGVRDRRWVRSGV